MRILNHYLAIAAISAFLFSPRLAEASILIVIDISNPSAVTFTTTEAVPLINDSSTSTAHGVSLMGLFSSAFAVSDQPLVGDLTPAGSSVSFEWLLNNFEGITGFDLNLYSNSSDSQVFSTGTPAFSGSGVSVNLDGATFATSGNIIVGDTLQGSGDIIGQWAVVPEPSSSAILTGLAAGVMLFVRRRQRLFR
jgi:hypothetical protein